MEANNTSSNQASTQQNMFASAQQPPQQNNQYNYNANYNQWQQYNQYNQYQQYNQYNPYNNYPPNQYNNNAQNYAYRQQQYSPVGAYNNYAQSPYNNIPVQQPPPQQPQMQQQPPPQQVYMPPKHQMQNSNQGYNAPQIQPQPQHQMQNSNQGYNASQIQQPIPQNQSQHQMQNSNQGYNAPQQQQQQQQQHIYPKTVNTNKKQNEYNKPQNNDDTDLEHAKKITELNFDFIDQFDQQELDRFKDKAIENDKYEDEPVMIRQISPVQSVKKIGINDTKYANISENELYKKMDTMMRTMGIPENAKISMLNQSREQKIKMIIQFERQFDANNQPKSPIKSTKSPKLSAKIEKLKFRAKKSIGAFNDKYSEERVAGMDGLELDNNNIENEPEGQYIDIQIVAASKNHVYGKYSNISELQLSKKMESMMKVMNLPQHAKDTMRNQTRQQKIQMILSFEEQFFAKEKAEREKEKEKKTLKYKISAVTKSINLSPTPKTPTSPNGTKKKKKLFKLFGPKTTN